MISQRIQLISHSWWRRLFLLIIQGKHMDIRGWNHVNCFVFSLPDDSAPQQGKDHKENQWSPDDKMIDPSPIMRVQSQLQMRRETGNLC